MYSEHFPNRLLLAFLLCLSSWLAGDEVPKRAPTSKQARYLKVHRCVTDAASRYKEWLNEDVRWIISDQERVDFMKRCDDKQRDGFVEAFWARRDPTPASPENEFKEEHYRRIAYSNEHFAGTVPGWKMDRGRVYILYGPPDTIERHSSDGEGFAAESKFPFEKWHYRFIESIGKDVDAEFVDTCRCGDYRLMVDPARKQPIR